MAFVFVLSRKRRFRCERCGELFFSHTVGSRVWLVLWIFFWISVVLAIAGMLIDTAMG